MTTRFTVTVRCDERAAPDCLRERVETHATVQLFQWLAVRLLQEGWDWDGPDRELGGTHDVCPACVDYAEEQRVAQNPDRAK